MLIKKITIGDKIKRNLLERLGIKVSFENNFNPSATACNKPKKPTILGPFLFCKAAKTFLSKIVIKAVYMSTKIITSKLDKTIIPISKKSLNQLDSVNIFINISTLVFKKSNNMKFL